MNKLLTVVVSILAFCSHLQAEVIVYPIPEGAPVNDTYVVRVRPLNGEWQQVGVYNAEVRTSWDTKTNASMTYLDFDEPVEIEIQISSVYVNKVNIRPVRYHLSYSKLDQHTFRFIMERPRKISVEVNDMIYNNLHLFARYPEEDPVTSSRENMIFFGPGFHQVNEQIILDNDQTLYVAGGAYVEIDVSHDPAISSHIYASGKSNIAVRGRGILHMTGPSFGDVHGPQGLRLLGCSSVKIAGINMLKQSRGWTNNAHDCTNVLFNDLGVISVSRNGDGIDIVGSQQAVVKNCFVRASDDALTVKSWTGDQKMEDVLFQDCIAWNDITSHPMEIGFELRAPYVRDITYRNIDVIHSNENGVEPFGAISISHGDNARLYNVLYENIYVEKIHDYSNHLIHFNILYHPLWSLNAGSENRGSGSDIVLKNIFYDGNHPSSIEGYDPDNGFDGITIDNMYYRKKLATDAEDANLEIGPYTRNVDFINSTGLIAHWNFDEKCCDVLYDNAPFDNVAKMENVERVEGISGKAVRFHGDQRAVVKVHPVMNLSDAGFTISMYAMFEEQFSGKRGLLGSADVPSLNNFPSVFVVDGTDIEFGFGTGSEWKGHTLENVLEPGRWYHLSYTLDRKNFKEVFYIDGTAVFSKDETGKPVTDAGLVLGGSGETYWKGAIDEIKIFNEALKANEISGIESELLGFWSLDDRKGLQVTDSSYHHNHGLIYTAFWTPDGEINGALNFPGNQGVMIEGDEALDLSDRDFTITAHCFFDETFDGLRPVLGHESQTAADRYPSIFIKDGTDIVFGFGTGNGWLSHTIPDVVEPGRWYHLAYSLDQENEEEKFYLDGVLLFSETERERPINKNKLSVGKVGLSFWKGMIDDVRIYGRVLSNTEILQEKVRAENANSYTSVTTNKVQHYTVYPNPADNVLNIAHYEGIAGVARLYDNTGRFIFTKHIPGWQGSIDVSRLETGIYYLILDNDDFSEYHKVIITN